MTIYSELLQLVLAREGDCRDRPVGALVSDALSCRARLTASRDGGPAGRSGQALDRMADSLAYDAALVRLCLRLGMQHHLTVDGDVTAARMVAEAGLAERLPAIAATLAGPGSGSSSAYLSPATATDRV
jgi:hypothetical protein